MPHRFEDAEAWAKVFDEPGRDAWQKPDEVVTLLDLPQNGVVADLGAGTGYFLARMSRGVGPQGKVLGLDVEADMVRYMTERAKREGLTNVEARAVATDDPGLAAASVDRILVVDTWHHIERREAYVPLLAKALRPGGALVVVDFTLETERGPPKKHRIAPEQVVRELEAAGLQATIASETLPDQYVVRGVRSGS
jgi:ubiquinone/menaquinone biosynthesis C-methylase UbiE